MKQILSIGSMMIILSIILNCSINDTDQDNSNSDIINVDIQTENSPESLITPSSDSYQLSTLTPSLDFTEVLTDTAYIKLTNNSDVSYPYEISNSLEWLSFSNLTGTVHESEEIITAYVNFNQFGPQEIKEDNITINSGAQFLTIPVTAQNY